MRVRRVSMVLGLCGLVVAAALIVRGRRHARPNVILVCVDTLRADHVHAAGYARDTTPHLDRLIRRSVSFRHAYSQFTSTQSSIGSLFTSRHPHHFISWRDRLALGRIKSFRVVPSRFPVMAEYFKKHGYFTTCIHANMHLDAKFGFDCGFDEYHFVGGSVEDPEGQGQYARAPALQELLFERYPDGLARRSPYFLYLHYMDPHEPYMPRRPFKGRYGHLSRSPRLSEANAPRENAYAVYQTLTDEEVAYMVARYDEEIRYWDEQFARLLAALERRGTLDNTLLIIFADHGEQFLEHGYFGHGSMCSIEEVHVPLIVHGLGLKPKTVERPVGLIDIFPTLVDLIAKDPGALRFADGASLAGLLHGRPGARRDRADGWVFSEGLGTLSVRGSEESYVLCHSPARLYGRARRRFRPLFVPEITHQYYRLDDDPREERDVFARHQDAAARLNFMLRTQFDFVVSKDYWFGEDALGPWLEADTRRLKSVLTLAPPPQGVTARLAVGADGGHTLAIANPSDAAQGVELTIKTKPTQVYLFGAVYEPATRRALRFALRDGEKRLLDEPVDSRAGSPRHWTRATPIKNRTATLTITLPPHSSVRVDRLHAIEVHFLTAGSAPREALTEEERWRLRGLGYRE